MAEFAGAATPGGRRERPPRDLDFHVYVEDRRRAALRKALLTTKDFSLFRTPELSDMFWHLRDYTYFCGVEGRYDEAVECEKLATSIRMELDDRCVSLLPNNVAKAFERRVQEPEKVFVSIRSSADCEVRAS
jgi:hypothetical protein